MKIHYGRCCGNKEIPLGHIILHPSRRKNKYRPINYIEPQAKNTGFPPTIRPIVLVQISGKKAVFLFCTPFYQTNKVPFLLVRQENFMGLI
jgi:hypothetical protein